MGGTAIQNCSADVKHAAFAHLPQPLLLHPQLLPVHAPRVLAHGHGRERGLAALQLSKLLRVVVGRDGGVALRLRLCRCKQQKPDRLRSQDNA